MSPPKTDGRTRQVALQILPHQQVPKGNWDVWLLFGGRGVGKSWRLTSWVTHQALAYPGTRWAAVGRTWSETRSILAEGQSGIRAYLESVELTELLEGGNWQSAYTRVPGNMEVKFANGSVIQFASADKPDALRGGNFNGAICDEVAFWDQQSWSNLRLATRIEPAAGVPPRIVAATTPNGLNWFFRDLVDAAPLPGLVFIGGGDMPPVTAPSTFDNIHLSEQAVDTFKSIYEGTDVGQQELYGQFLSSSGSIYQIDGHDHTEHSGETFPTGPDMCDEVVAGLDLGAENPSAFIVLARVDTRWFAVSETYGPAATPDQLHDMISTPLAQWRPTRIIADTNFPQTTNHLRALGLPIVDADKRAGSVLDGIRAVQATLTQRNLMVHTEQCPNLWAELRGYRWATDKNGDPLTPERPVKRNDHACDAIRYALHMMTVGPTRDLLFS